MKKDAHPPANHSPEPHRTSARTRLDVILVQRNLAETREQAQRLILAGVVFVDGSNAVKPGARVPADTPIEVTRPEKYVSRGGAKLEGALKALNVDPAGIVCADIGAATGGFTDCLLQHGAARVYAVDVGTSQLHERLRRNPRVILVNHTNARHLEPSTLPEVPSLIVADLSFISLEKVLPALQNIACPATRLLALVKPQFESPRATVSKWQGIIRDPMDQRRALEKIAMAAPQAGWLPLAVTPSAVLGSHGNQEWFMLLRLRMDDHDNVNLTELLSPCPGASGTQPGDATRSRA